MHTGKGSITELILEDGFLYARISCPDVMVPAPGQYVLAGDASGSPLPVPIFYTDSAPGGFIAPASSHRKLVDDLYLRGPLGRGFTMPPTARKIALIACDESPARLRGLIRPALKQSASVVLLCSSTAESLPDEVEVQPLSTMAEALEWADYVALDVGRENLPALREKLSVRKQLAAVNDAQVLIRTPMPCGEIADCGVCAVITTTSWKLACKDGPVFDWREI